jgi:hypothetical protein
MKLSKNDLDKKAKQITFDLICFAGLKKAQKITMQIRRNLKAEENRRKNIEGEK